MLVRTNEAGIVEYSTVNLGEAQIRDIAIGEHLLQTFPIANVMTLSVESKRFLTELVGKHLKNIYTNVMMEQERIARKERVEETVSENEYRERVVQDRIKEAVATALHNHKKAQRRKRRK